jgi:cytochrome c oxidase cbb3-type subunit I/II
LAEAPALTKISPHQVKGEKWHAWLERKPIQFTLLTTVAVAIGGIVQIVPMLVVKSNIPTIASSKTLYTVRITR